jgi:hypothetical protein
MGIPQIIFEAKYVPRDSLPMKAGESLNKR